MIHVFRNASLLLPLCFLFTACTRTQLPPPGDTASLYGNDDDLIASSIDGEWGPEELQARGTNDSYTDGNYKGRPSLMGLFQPVYFNFDSAGIATAERAKLQEAARYLSKNKNSGVLLEGHCDWYGTSEYNLVLGDRRANSIGNYIDTLGINPERIEKLSKGSLEATSGLSKAQSSQNRRADLIVLKK